MLAVSVLASIWTAEVVLVLATMCAEDTEGRASCGGAGCFEDSG
jgi:hypothetical protein